jgi:hypothetical protein
MKGQYQPHLSPDLRILDYSQYLRLPLKEKPSKKENNRKEHK